MSTTNMFPWRKMKTNVSGYASYLITKTRLNILKILPPKTEIFQIKNSDIFHFFLAQNIDSGYSLELPR